MGQVNKLLGRTRHIDELITEVEGRINDPIRQQKPKQSRWYLAPLLAVLAGAGAYYAYDLLSQKASEQMPPPVQQATKQAIPAPVNVSVQKIASDIPPSRRVADIPYQAIESSGWSEEGPSIAVVPPSSSQPSKPGLVAREEILVSESTIQLPMAEAPKPYTPAEQKTMREYPSRLTIRRKPVITEYPSRNLSKEIRRKVEPIMRSPPVFAPASFMRTSAQRRAYIPPAPGARSVQGNQLYRQPAGRPYRMAANNSLSHNRAYQKIIQKK
jgi:hypothetical protein